MAKRNKENNKIPWRSKRPRRTNHLFTRLQKNPPPAGQQFRGKTSTIIVLQVGELRFRQPLSRNLMNSTIQNLGGY